MFTPNHDRLTLYKDVFSKIPSKRQYGNNCLVECNHFYITRTQKENKNLSLRYHAFNLHLQEDRELTSCVRRLF